MSSDSIDTFANACPNCEGKIIAHCTGSFHLLNYYFRQYMNGKCQSCGDQVREFYERFDKKSRAAKLVFSLSIVSPKTKQEISFGFIGCRVSDILEKEKYFRDLKDYIENRFKELEV